MERRSFLKNTGLAGILAAGSAPAIAQTPGEVKWRLASSFPKSLDTIYSGGETLAKFVRKVVSDRVELVATDDNQLQLHRARHSPRVGHTLARRVCSRRDSHQFD